MSSELKIIPPLAPDAPITRANLAQALAEIAVGLPRLGDPAFRGGLCIAESGAGGPITYVPPSAFEAEGGDHA